MKHFHYLLLTLFFISANIQALFDFSQCNPCPISVERADNEVTPYKIIYLVSAPRSLSVAFTRMMHARGDCKIIHEPSMWVKTLKNNRTVAIQSFDENGPETFEDVKKKLYQDNKASHVFVKDIGLTAAQFLLKDIDFLQRPNVYFVFLVRNPHHAILSLYRKALSMKNIGDTAYYEPIYKIYRQAKQYSPHAPYIILSEELYTEPEKTVQKFCEHVGLPFIPESLHWPDGGEEFFEEATWMETKNKRVANYWHKDAMRSTGFGKPTYYAVDKEGKPTFSEIVNQEHKLRCKEIYEVNLSFYKLFLKAHAQQNPN